MSIWYEFAEFGESFYETAPYRIVTQINIDAPPSDVFAALQDEKTWEQWMPILKKVEWKTARPLQKGSKRRLTTRNGRRIDEQCIGYTHDVQLAFMIERSTYPFMRRAGAEFVIAPRQNGCKLVWTLAIQPRGFRAQLSYYTRPIARFLLRGMLRKFKKMVESQAD